jgi:glyoxylase-like metal-dependent hydrolase (beta-lactamase superfamily II)
MNKVKILVKGYAKEIENGWLATSNTTLIQTNGLNIIADPGINKNLLLNNLKSEGLGKNDVDYVFLTHYHPDHALLAALFLKAKIFDGDTIYENDKETGYENTLPETDIEVFATPGHAHEHASLSVITSKGKIVIAGDVFWWMDNEVQKTDSKILLAKDDPFTKDKKRLLESRKKVLEIADLIIPGHGEMFKVKRTHFPASDKSP